MKAAPEGVRMAISLVHQPTSGGVGSPAPSDAPSLADRKAMFGSAGGGGAKAGDDLGLLAPLVEERVSAPYLTKLSQGLLWRCGWSALHLPARRRRLYSYNSSRMRM